MPRSCAVGHVDVKFSLHPMCTSPPNIQVTLLKQNITNIGRHITGDSSTGGSSNHASRSAGNPLSAHVDSAINFNIPNAKPIAMVTDATADVKDKPDGPEGVVGGQGGSTPITEASGATSTSSAAPAGANSLIYSQSSVTPSSSSKKHQTSSSSAASAQSPSTSSSVPSASSPSAAAAPSAVKMSVINNVLEPGFLKRYAAEILCGPVELAANVDLSGHSGVVTLSSAHLLKVRTRSFLVHIKALHDGSQEDTTGKKVRCFCSFPFLFHHTTAPMVCLYCPTPKHKKNGLHRIV